MILGCVNDSREVKVSCKGYLVDSTIFGAQASANVITRVWNAGYHPLVLAKTARPRTQGRLDMG